MKFQGELFWCLHLSLQGSTLIYSELKLSIVYLAALNSLFKFQHWHCLIYSNGCSSVIPITVLTVGRPLSHLHKEGWSLQKADRQAELEQPASCSRRSLEELQVRQPHLLGTLSSRAWDWPAITDPVWPGQGFPKNGLGDRQYARDLLVRQGRTAHAVLVLYRPVRLSHKDGQGK